MTPPGERQSNRKDIGILFGVFLVSRILSSLFGIHLQYDALYKYWQYLDVGTLQHQLLKGVWYDHAQPPAFNLLLGIVLKIGGSNAPLLFAALLKLISLANVLLIWSIIRRLTGRPRIALALSLLYMLSPALIIFESELFYTTFMSLMLLTSAWFITRLFGSADARDTASPNIALNIAGICLPMVIACLTRSMYHIAWLGGTAACLLIYFRKRAAFRPLLAGFTLSLMLVAGWYLKNKIIFGQFSTSTWLGMNFARTVFHDNTTTDSSRIEAIEPFQEIRYYRPFIHDDARSRWAGLDDRDLISETKNDTFLNLHHVDYIEVSRLYMKVSTDYVRAHPKAYAMNVVQSSIMFFAPATRYPFAEAEAAKIKYYDVLYSFNLTHFAQGKGQRRIALIISAIPKIIIYLGIAWLLVQDIRRRKTISALNIFILCTIGFVFITGSLLEHYENMRFRYEVEPLFLLLAGQIIARLPKLQKKPRA